MSTLTLAAARRASIVAALIAAAYPVAASAAPPVITRSDALSITMFPALGPSGCAQLFTANLVLFERGKQDALGPGPSALLLASGQNLCTGRSFSTEGFAQGITYVRNKESVSATGTLVVTTREDFSEVTFTEVVTFNVDVTAASVRASRNWGSNHFINAGVKSSFHFDSEFRPATASGLLTGTLFGASFSTGMNPDALWFEDRNRAIVRERIR